MFGAIFVLLSTVFNFLPPIGLDMDEHKPDIVIYYSAFWGLWACGAAMLNTSHLAMIPELCDSDEARMSLTLIRNSMINLTNILAYIAALIVFSSGKLRYVPLVIRCLRWKTVIIYHTISNTTCISYFSCTQMWRIQLEGKRNNTEI